MDTISPPLQLSVTDFGDAQSYLLLMGHLSTNFHVFQCHEDIENRYIVGELMPRLPCHRHAKLENDLHSDNRSFGQGQGVTVFVIRIIKPENSPFSCNTNFSQL